MSGRAAQRFIAVVITLSQVMWIACGTPASVGASRTVRVGYSGVADFGDLPSFLAQARLRAEGYRIDVTHFSEPYVAVGALAQGTVDVTHGSMLGAWTAIGRGARLRTVMDHVANPYRFIGTAGLLTCTELTARHLALPGESAVSTQLVRAFMQEECPAARPVTTMLMESSNRSAAFLAGGIAATPLELNVWMWLQGQAPGRFTMLSDFSRRWPLLKTTGVHVNMDFAAAHPDLVREYVRALVAATRDAIADPGTLESVAREKLAMSDQWLSVARAYVAEGVWQQDGGLTREDIEFTLDFFKTHGRLDGHLTASAVVDLTFLEEALVPRK